MIVGEGEEEEEEAAAAEKEMWMVMKIDHLQLSLLDSPEVKSVKQ